MEATFILLVVLAFTMHVTAWDEDPRCQRRRELRTALPAKNTVPEESGLVIPDAHEVDTAGLSRDRLEEEQSLRLGNEEDSHRQLQDDFDFQVKMYWKEGFCVRNLAFWIETTANEVVCNLTHSLFWASTVAG